MRLGKRTVARGLILIGYGCTGSSARAEPNPQKGRAISGQCDACHGSNGISVAANIPNLAVQHYRNLLNQLEAFKNGTRKNPIMNSFASGWKTFWSVLPFVAFLVDVSGWFLTKLTPGFVYVVILRGGFFILALAVMILPSPYDIWLTPIFHRKTVQIQPMQAYRRCQRATRSPPTQIGPHPPSANASSIA